jgi:hypothetical protein
MANFQDFVELRGDTRLHQKGDAVIVGTSPGAKSLILSNDVAEMHVAGNPTVNRTLSIPDSDGTFALSNQLVGGIGVSTGGNTAGTTGTTQGTYVLAGGNNVTLSQSTAVGSLATVTISAANSATVVSGIGVSTGGNTAGDTGTRLGTYVLAGGNQITLSQSTAAGSLATVTVSGRDAVFGAGVSTGGNTAGDTGTRTGTLVFAGINGITLSQATAAGGATITISGGGAGTVVSAIGVSTGGNTAGDTGTTVGTYVLAGGNQITLSQATAAGSLATVTISARDAVFGAGVSTGGNTAGDTGTRTGTIVFAGGAGIIVSQATGAATNTVSMVNSWSTATTVSQVTNANVVGANAGRFALEGHQHAGIAAEGVSTGGGTLGDTGTQFGTFIFAGIGNITLSQSTGAGGQHTITISGGAAAGTGVAAIGVSTGGNTSGTTGTTQGTYVLAGGNQITLSQSTAAGSLATVTISGRDAVFAMGVSTGGNTTGDTGTQTGTIVLAGSNGVTLSQSTGGAGQHTVFITAGNTARSFSFGEYFTTAMTLSNANVVLFPFNIPHYMTATRAMLLAHMSGNTNSSGAITISLGVYSMSGSTASLASSESTQIIWTSGTNSTASTATQFAIFSGTRYRALTLGSWGFTPGDYIFGMWFRTTNNGTFSFFGRSTVSMVSEVFTSITQNFLPGYSTSSFTTAFPGSINVTNTDYVRTGSGAQRIPSFLFMGSV